MKGNRIMEPYHQTFRDKFDNLVSSRAFNLSLVLLMIMATGVTVYFAERQNYLTILSNASNQGQEENFSVIVPTDIVNEDGATFTIADSGNTTSWIGTGTHSDSSYLGIMFKGSGIPITAKVLSARLDLYSVATQWLPVDSTIYAEDNEVPAIYSQDAPPSSRKPTEATITYSTNDKWESDEKYSIDVTKPVQELFKKYPSARIVNIIMKGTGGKLSKKFFYNEQNTGRSPSLTITYL